MHNSNPYYCANILNGLYVEKVSDQQLKVSACCLNKLGEAQSTVDFFTDSHLQTQRKLMMDHQPIPGCDTCYRAEKEGHYSRRNTINAMFENTNQSALVNLDYNVDPICNAKCIICSSYYSSAWAAEDQQFGVNKKHNRFFSNTRHNQLSQTIDLTTVKKIYFNGGEPMLSNEPRAMLQRLKSIGRLSEVAVHFNTNGSIEPSEEMIELWSQCRAVTVIFSIDGTGPAFEYIRNPLKWNQIEKVVDQFGSLNLPNYFINIGYTAGIHNVDIIENTYQWFINKSNNWKFRHDFAVHPCFGVLDISNAEPELKQYWLEQLSCQENRKWHKFLKNRIQSTANTTQWRQWLEILDHRRSLNWRESLPELANACKNLLLC